MDELKVRSRMPSSNLAPRRAPPPDPPPHRAPRLIAQQFTLRRGALGKALRRAQQFDDLVALPPEFR
jgi:hypothetical protein